MLPRILKIGITSGAGQTRSAKSASLVLVLEDSQKPVIELIISHSSNSLLSHHR